MYRFVILQHQTSTTEHWDVMLETDCDLAAWSIVPQCASGKSFAWPAERLPAHRKHYLDYEGEVSQNRGTVRQIDTGQYEQHASEVLPEVFPKMFILHGKHFAGTLTIRDHWMEFEKMQ